MAVEDVNSQVDLGECPVTCLCSWVGLRAQRI